MTPRQLSMFESAEQPLASNRTRRILSQLRHLHEQLNEELEYGRANERPTITNPSDAAELLAPFLAPLEQEEVWVILLDTRNRVIHLDQVYRGSLNVSMFRVGELYREAIRRNAAGIILAHNHPSSDCSPSSEDVACTRSVIEAGDLIDIPLLDHVIIGKTSFVSLKERGLAF